MFDIGMTELLVIGVVALIVVGPKDLPGMFRTLGRFTGKMKGMAREFSRAMSDAADDAGIKDVSNTLKSATSPSKMGLDRLNDAVDKFEKWTPGKAAKTTKTDSPAPDLTGPTAKGPETQKLSEERAAAAKKIHEATARREAEKAGSEAGSEGGAEAVTGADTNKAPTLAAAPKPATQKPATQKPVLSKPEPKADPSAPGADAAQPTAEATPKDTGEA
jgi:sec-independent protein translocase protein TatB